MLLENIELITADTKFHAPYTHRIILMCEEKNIPYNLTLINLQNKPKWFLDISSKGEVPLMRINNKVIIGSFNIACYLDQLSSDINFIPPDYNTSFIQILQLIDNFGHELVMFCRERRNTIPDLISLNKFMEKLNTILQKQYLLGEFISYLDFALIPHILQIYAFESLVFPFSMLVNHKNLLTWLNLMQTRNSVKFTSQNHTEFFIEHLKHRGFFTQFTTK